MNPGGALAASCAAVIYGSAYVATVIALEGFSPAGIGVWRGLGGAALVAAALALPAMRAQRPARLSRAALARLAVLGLVGGGLFILAVNAAVASSGATVTAFVAGLYAVLAAIFAIPMLGERLEPHTVVALVAALLGTLLLSDLGTAGVDPVGIGLGLAAALAFGLFLVLSRRWSLAYGLTGATVGLASLTISAVVTAIVAAVDGTLVPQSPPLDAMLAMAWIAAGPGATAAVLVVIGMRRLPARVASLFLLLNPPTAAALGFVLLGERLSPSQVAGAALVLVAIAAASGVLSARGVSGRRSRPGAARPTGS